MLGQLVQELRAAASDTAPQTRDFTGKFGLTWEPSSDQTYYASFSRGIKGVGFNNGFSAFGTLAANVATPGPGGQEVLDAFELGAKTRVFDRRLSVNPALFYYLYDSQPAAPSRDSGFVAFFQHTKARG